MMHTVLYVSFIFQFSDAKNKIADINAVLSSVIKSRCNCSFTSDLILDSQFSCDVDSITEVLFHAYIYQTTDTEPENLLNYLKEWASSSDSIGLVVNGARLLAMQICGINSTHETFCPLATLNNKSSKGLPMYLIYVIIGGCVGVLIAGMCVCLVVCVICKLHRNAEER